MAKGLLVVISGFSGVGKGTVIQMVLDALPNLRFSVSCTTRAPRPGETDGVNYYFLSESEFEEKIAKGEFVEYTRTFTNYYGTLRSEIDGPVAAGVDILMELNVVGAANIKKLYPDCVTVFVCPPSYEALKARLVGRGTESEESLRRRLNEIEAESRSIPYYDYAVTNVVAKECADKIVGIINSEHLRTSRADDLDIFHPED